jgi:hypothetical protein
LIIVGRWGGLIGGPIAVVLGALMALAGWWRFDQARVLASRGQVAHATVSASHDVVEDGEPATYVTLSYVVAGETIQREERIAPTLYDRDGTIDVVYDPQHPHEHMVVGTQVSGSATNVQIGGGIAIALFGIVAFVLGIRGPRE